MMRRVTRRAAFSACVLALACAVSVAGQRAPAATASAATLSGRIDAILARPAFRHAMFGIEF